MHILGLPTDIFNVYPASVKFKTYQARWQIGDIYVSGDARKTEDNPQGLGCYLVMTGRGCEMEIIQSVSSLTMFEHIPKGIIPTVENTENIITTSASHNKITA